MNIFETFKLMTTVAVVVSLGACATRPKPPQISFDEAAFDPAVMQIEPAKPIKIVELMKPLPCRGN